MPRTPTPPDEGEYVIVEDDYVDLGMTDANVVTPLLESALEQVTRAAERWWYFREDAITAFSADPSMLSAPTAQPQRRRPVQRRRPDGRFLAADACTRCFEVECRCQTCYHCGNWLTTGTVGVRQFGDEDWNRRFYHDACLPNPCDGCNRSLEWGDMTAALRPDGSSTHRCRNCRVACQGRCGRYLVHRTGVYADTHDTLCPSCEEDRRLGPRMLGYQHTRPHTWMGGPLPTDDKGRQVGFYIGFELEVTSSTRRVGSLNRWAEEHLGSEENMDCKSDSSVAGFEIATQPMTPEFFESVDWESLFEVLNRDHPARLDNGAPFEPDTHGLHVHIGRKAFERDDVATAMFCYLIGQDDGSHLERVGRRQATNYCRKVPKPAAAAIVSRAVRHDNEHGTMRSYQPQPLRLVEAGVRPGRDAINHQPRDTIEIRAFKSTRNADELRASVRMVYLAARYIAHLRKGFVHPKSLHWSAFVDWVQDVMPEAADALRAPVGPVPSRSTGPTYMTLGDRMQWVPLNAQTVTFRPFRPF